MYDRVFLHRILGCLAALLGFTASFQVAKADVPPPPPPPPASQTISGSPNGFPLTQTVNGPHGRVTVEIPRGAMDSRFSTVSSGSGGNLNGFRNMPSQFTDGYGNVARGNVRTATAIPNGSGGLNTVVKGFIGAQITGAVLNSNGARTAAATAAQGDYAQASLAAASAFDVFGIGQGINNLSDIFRDAQDAKVKQAIAKAAAQQQQNAKALANGKLFYAVLDTGTDPGTNNERGAPVIGGYWVAAGSTGNRGQVDANGKPFDRFLQPLPLIPNADGTGYQKVWIQIMPKGYSPPAVITPQDVMLSQAQMQQAMIDALNRNTLTQQQLTQLINAMWRGGHLNPSNTKTTVVGTAADNTFLTAPFTPLGSNTAQQTHFTVNPDGSVTVSTVQRADLAANTSQAPTRQQVGQSSSSSQTQTQPAKDGSTAEKPDICAQNPGSLMCADMGGGDYTDPVIPEKPIDFNLNPANIFRSDGVCPAPATFELFGKVYQFDYSQLCSFLRMLRPIVILAAMVMAFKIAYDAVKEV